MTHRQRVGRGATRFVLFLFVMAIVAACAVAQVSTSAVRGTVTDQQGGVVPNATVTLTNKANSQVRTMKTGAAGNFSFDLLPPGDYVVKIEAAGFKTLEKPVEALIARPSDLGTIPLQVGAQNQVVTVSAENQAVEVNTQDSSLGNNFVSEQITQLPIEARNVLSLLTLQAGVTKDGSVAGARSDQSNVTLDGVNINDAQTNEITGTGATAGPVLRLNSEAVEEFRVNTMTANAAAGRAGGAQIDLVTKSGTNQFHGALFEFHRNTIFEANDWFNKHATPQLPRETLIRNTFGGAFGGPIKKDKLFFFYSYEGRRDASSKSVSQYGGARIIPTASLAQGNIISRVCTAGGSCTGTRTLTPADIAAIFPDTGGENPAALQALQIGARFTPNSTSVGDGLNTGGFLFNAPTPVKLNSHVAKFDYNINQKQSLFARLNIIYDHDGSADVQYFPDRPAPTVWSHPWGIAVGHTWTIHNNLISNFKYGLTRQAFSQTGDTQGNYNYLRLVYYDTNGTRTASRTTPVHNFVEDMSWVKGRHTFQFGGTVNLINNGSVRYGSAFDTAYANPSGYKTNMIIDAVNNYLESKYNETVDPAMQSQIENAITAVLGRYNNYTANFTFDHDGKLLPSGTPSVRHFATQGYEMYIQDAWKIRQNLTLSAGLRYSLWRPVYETNGYEAQPNITLAEFFARRVAGMNAGQPYNDLITVDKSGPVNGGKPMYNWDKTVFLPKVAVAWSPRFESSWLQRIFGTNEKSVIRGGFAISNDYFGPQIATFFDTRNTLGFNSAQVIPVNTFNVGCGQYVVNGFYGGDASKCVSAPGPLFTGFGQDVRSLPLITPPASLSFPQQKPEKKYPTAIESSLDAGLVTPKNYGWNLTFEREIPHGGLVSFSYIGRSARNLLAQRDVMTPTNLRDPKSGMDWYTAATILEKARQAGVDPSYFAANPIPYFENLFPKLITAWGYATATQAVYDDAYSYNANDWTTTMLDIDGYSITPVAPGQTYSHAFYQPQYGALATWTTIGYSNYNAFTATYRERMNGLTVDFNYTYSHSLDNASGLQSAAGFSSSALILNPFRPQDNYAASDFDMRHMINVSSVWELPIGKGRKLLGNLSGVAEAFLGGWQLSNIFRWNSGIPFGAPYDANTWSTNWENQSATTRTRPIPNDGCPTRNVPGNPKFFGGCLDQAFASFRPSYPGETGERNTFRFPGYINMDMGVGKTWKIGESRDIQFRWETFNLTNTQRFGENLDWSRSGWGIIPGATAPTANFSNFRQIQGSPRVMQFGLRIAF
jgi:hypothetical protein